MAEPGDPPASEDPALTPEESVVEQAPAVHAPPQSEPTVVTAPEDMDDLIGFTSRRAMEGRPREVLTVKDPPADALVAPQAEAPTVDAMADRAQTAPAGVDSISRPVPAWAVETPVAERKTFGRASAPPEPVEGAMWAYTIYAMILFAVPTLGVSAVIGILAVTGRSAPEHAVARSHYIYQQRTLWASAVAALLGLILIVVNLGVFVLFALAVWMLARGAVGVWRLKAGLSIADPQRWLF